MGKAWLVRGLTRLGEHGSRSGHIAPGELQTGQKYLAENEAVNDPLILPRQVEALSPMLLCGLQIIPFIEHPGQPEMRFVDNLQRLITGQLQDAPVRLSRQRELVFR